MIDDVFSLCFGSVEGDGALMLGDVDLSEQDIELRYTSLLSSLAHPHYYSVQLESLWVGDVQLPVRQVHLSSVPTLNLYIVVGAGFIDTCMLCTSLRLQWSFCKSVALLLLQWLRVAADPKPWELLLRSTVVSALAVIRARSLC